MKDYTLLDAINNLDLEYIAYMPEEFYYDHVYWRIHHYFMNERCDTCRNWHFYSKYDKQDYGTCEIDECNYKHYHAWCPCWNLDPVEDPYASHTRDEDGCERRFVTPLGKVITQRCHGSAWIYLYEGEPKWWPR